MILTELPDLPPRPLTPANAAFRRRFYERWGRENAIVCGRAARAEYAVWPQALSIKTVADGSERYALARRELAVDDDTWLVLNEGSRYGSVLAAPSPSRAAFSFCVFFRPGLVAEVAAARRRTLGAALDDPQPPTSTTSPGFAEHLHAHGGAIGARLAAMAAAVRGGERSDEWLEEELTALAGELLAAEERTGPAPQSARAAQRQELRRRLRLSLDFMHSRFNEPLTLERMAAAACLSRWHFVREFARAYGPTPHLWLMRKRAHAARRWLADGNLSRAEVAALAGFGSRWAMRRALERAAREG